MNPEKEKRDIEKIKKKWPGSNIASVSYDGTGKAESFLYKGELYNPAEYWHAKGIDYQPSGEMEGTGTESEAPEVENLKRLLIADSVFSKKILEIGSGYGRIYQELKTYLDDIFKRFPPVGDTQPMIDFSMCDFVPS